MITRTQSHVLWMNNPTVDSLNARQLGSPSAKSTLASLSFHWPPLWFGFLEILKMDADAIQWASLTYTTSECFPFYLLSSGYFRIGRFFFIISPLLPPPMVFSRNTFPCCPFTVSSSWVPSTSLCSYFSSSNFELDIIFFHLAYFCCHSSIYCIFLDY